MEAIKLDKQEFQIWLEKHQDNDVVGESISFHLCPIANFFQYCGAAFSCCYEEKISYVCSGIYYVNQLLPEWAIQFIKRIDNILDKEKQHCNITARQALEVLEIC